jgi:hypothetical protein
MKIENNNIINMKIKSKMAISGDEKINERIEKFNVYKGSFTRFLLYHYYIFVFLYLIIGTLGLSWSTTLDCVVGWNTGLDAILAAITILIAAFFSISMLEKIPNSFKRIWDRNIILSKGDEKDTKDKFITFLDNFEKNLNSKIGAICGFGCVYIFLLGVYHSPWLITPFVEVLSYEIKLSYLYVLPHAIHNLFFGFYIYIFGMILYRMYITVKYIRKISQEFDLKIQVLHPDKCGGLKPIGDLCLSNSFILIAVGIFLAIATIFFEGFQVDYARGLFIVILFSIVGFVLPVYQIHKIMLKEKIKKLEILDRVVSDQIPVIDEPEKMELPEINKIKEYEVLQDQYKEVEEFKTWPFDISIWRKFITSEIVLIFSWGIAESGLLGKEEQKLLIDILRNLFGM